MSVIPSRTRLPAELPTVPWGARARPVGWVALAVNTLAVPFASRAPQSFAALAASCELLARRVVAVALDPAVPPGPTGVAQAPARHGIADGVDAAVAVVFALGTPDTRVTCALPALLVTLALLAQTGVLTVRAPAVVVASAPAGQVVALAVGVTITFPFAVGSPKLCRALC